MAKKVIGKITHYYPKIGVAVVELQSTLKVGDKILIEGKSNFEQTIESMQIDMKNISSAKKGQAIGLKVDEQVKANDMVYKAS